MTLLQEVFKEMKKMEMPKQRNLVAMGHGRVASGAGAHMDKGGKKAPRNRQKQQWKKETW
jgi:hypothetical protein